MPTSGLTVDGVVLADVVLDLERHVVAGAGALDLPVVDLHRLDLLLHVGGVADDVDAVAYAKRVGQRDGGYRQVAVVVRDGADCLVGIVSLGQRSFLLC